MNNLQKSGIEAFVAALILGILVWVVFCFVGFILNFSPVVQVTEIAAVYMQIEVVLFGFVTIAFVHTSKRQDFEVGASSTIALMSLFSHFFSILLGFLWIFGAFGSYSFAIFLPFSYTLIGIISTIVFLGYSLFSTRTVKNRADDQVT